MTHKQILDKMANDDVFNEKYFVLARSLYVESGEKRGALSLSIPDPAHFIRYLNNQEQEPNINMYPYDETDEMFENNNMYHSMRDAYDVDRQFLLYIETCNDKINDKWTSSFATITKKTPRTVYYSKSVSLSGSEFNQEEHVINTPCISCGELNRTKLDNLPYDYAKCSCCDDNIVIKEMYECTTCCAQYIYTM